MLSIVFKNILGEIGAVSRQVQNFIEEKINQEPTEQSDDMQEVFFDNQNEDSLDRQASQILVDIANEK